MFANIIPGISHEQLDKAFQYSVPEEFEDQIFPGSVVEVPFGGGNRIITGFVTELSESPDIDPDRIKPIAGVLSDSDLPESRMIAIAAWMKKEYGSTMSRALKTVLPVKEKVQKKEKKFITLSDDAGMVEGYILRMQKKKAVARLRLLENIGPGTEYEYDNLKASLNITAKTIKELSEAGIINVKTVCEYRNPVELPEGAPPEQLELNSDQKSITEDIITGINNGDKRTSLIYGITGSGKTLCYIELISNVISAGKQAIMLIPEIALTWQTVRRFQERFGDRVSVLNSRMSKGERYDQFLRASRGEIDVVIGPRSALFTPFEKIGIIIIDEEHESSYISENIPAYHALETAEFIAEMHGGAVVLGSATPSMASYYRALKGEYRLFTLENRATGAELPDVYTEDMRKELAAGNRGMFSRRLLNSITDRLEKKEQIMLFINKRGYAGFVSCRSCGHVFRCPHCDVSMNYHRNGNKLVCHYCGHEARYESKCPSCGSPYIAGFRAGTQQVEESLKKVFPSARVLRMDRDTTSGKDGHARVLKEFSDGKADILVGTQMIVKGHDFPGVTLVCAIAADLSLFAGDYRAAESTFQLLVQAAGRAGRGDKKGEMIIQTYAPENYAIQYAATQDYPAFYKEEIGFREMMNYPPVSYMLKLSLVSEDERLLSESVEVLKKRFFHSDLEEMGVNVIGPAKEPVYKMSDEFRMAVYIKSADKDVIDELRITISEYMKKEPAFRKVFSKWERA